MTAAAGDAGNKEKLSFLWVDPGTAAQAIALANACLHPLVSYIFVKVSGAYHLRLRRC